MKTSTTLTDKELELLELAAKAAGYAIYSQQNGKLNCGDGSGKNFHWNPLRDDGDAFRLAVSLGIVPQSMCSDEYDNLYSSAYVYRNGIEIASVREPYSNNPYAATRRAIVGAAAEIGKKLENQ